MRHLILFEDFTRSMREPKFFNMANGYMDDLMAALDRAHISYRYDKNRNYLRVETRDFETAQRLITSEDVGFGEEADPRMLPLIKQDPNDVVFLKAA